MKYIKAIVLVLSFVIVGSGCWIWSNTYKVNIVKEDSFVLGANLEIPLKPFSMGGASLTSDPGKASENSPVQYDKPPTVSNDANYYDILQADMEKARQKYGDHFDLWSVDPNKLLVLEVVDPCGYTYRDEKYDKEYFLPFGTLIYSHPGRYDYPKNVTKLSSTYTIQEKESTIERAEIEVYNRARLNFVPQIIVIQVEGIHQVYESYLKNNIKKISKGF